MPYRSSGTGGGYRPLTDEELAQLAAEEQARRDAANAAVVTGAGMGGTPPPPPPPPASAGGYASEPYGQNDQITGYSPGYGLPSYGQQYGYGVTEISAPYTPPAPPPPPAAGAGGGGNWSPTSAMRPPQGSPEDSTALTADNGIAGVAGDWLGANVYIPGTGLQALGDVLGPMVHDAVFLPPEAPNPYWTPTDTMRPPDFTQGAYADTGFFVPATFDPVADAWRQSARTPYYSEARLGDGGRRSSTPAFPPSPAQAEHANEAEMPPYIPAPEDTARAASGDQSRAGAAPAAPSPMPAAPVTGAASAGGSSAPWVGGMSGASGSGNGYGPDWDWLPAPSPMAAAFVGDSNDAGLWANPIFDRYFAVLEKHFGAARARTMMRGLGRRYTGKRSKRTKTKRRGDAPASSPSPAAIANLPTQEGIRALVDERLGRA